MIKHTNAIGLLKNYYIIINIFVLESYQNLIKQFERKENLTSLWQLSYCKKKFFLAYSKLFKQFNVNTHLIVCLKKISKYSPFFSCNNPQFI